MTVYITNGPQLKQMPLYGMERAMGLDDTIPEEGPIVAFRTFDDDGNRTTRGTLHNDDECINQSAALRYAESDEGATRIEVRIDGAWVQEIG